MAIMNVLSQMISLFMMMFVGFLAAKVGLIEPDFRRKLSSLVLNTACPCIIVSSVLKSGGAPSAMVATLGMSIVFYAVMIVLAFLLVHIVPTPPAERRLDQLMFVCTNLIFMGIPIIQSFYGAEGVSLLSMFILLFNFLVFTYGVVMVGGSDIKLKQLCNPGVCPLLRRDRLTPARSGGKHPVDNRRCQHAAGHDDYRRIFGSQRYPRSRFQSPAVPCLPASPDPHSGYNHGHRRSTANQSNACGHLRHRFRHAHCQQLRHALRRLYAAGYDRFSRHYRLNSGEGCHPAGHCRVDGRAWAGVKKYGKLRLYT